MVRYEWDVEVVTTTETDDHEIGEIVDHLFCDTFTTAKRIAALKPDTDTERRIVLVRDDDNARSWAYLVDGALPTHFTDAYENDYAKVPKRFHAEVAA